MSESRVIPHQDNPDRPTFTILVDGSEISGEYQILGVFIRKSVNSISRAQVLIQDGNPAEEDFPVSNGADFVPGKAIQINAGYHSNETQIFEGIIVGQGLRIEKDGPSMLVVECRDEAVKMTVGRKNMYFYEVKDSEVMDEIIGNYSKITPDVSATTATHEEMVQYYVTDWDFVVARAEMNGMLVYNTDNSITVAAPKIESEAKLSLIYGESILDFEAEMDARTQYSTVQSFSWDAADQEVLEMEGDDPQFTEAGNIKATELADVIGLESYALQHPGGVPDQELQAWADATLLRSRMAKIRGRVKCQGFANIFPGDTLELQGVGERFNGQVFVAGITQEISRDNWETNIQFGLSQDWFLCQHDDVMAKPASEMLPAMHGLQIGVVVALEGDPEGEDRIRVRMPMVSPSEEGVWARIATLDAGDGRGTVFRPEIDDEVMLGFLHGDPRDPVILGGLHSSAKPSPIAASDDNHEKGLVTRSGMEVLYDDDKISMTLRTPGGYQVILDEDAGTLLVEDGNGNKMEMSSSGIDIESGGDINITATGDVNIEGLNGNFKANAQFKAEGAAGAEISSSAITVVSGSLVQIN